MTPLPVTRCSGAPSRPPAWWPAGVYYGWALIGALGVTATVSFGVLSYAFAVFIDPMTQELGWSKATITGAFSLGCLVMGAAAIPIGRWVDRHGARGIMTGGSLLATLGLLAWSQVSSIAEFYAVWVVLGLASAAVLYEPAFAVVAAWFRGQRGRALTVLTFAGGFASVIFVPLTSWLVAEHGWREALLWLAGVYAPLTILPHAVVLRRRPGDLGLQPDGHAILPGSSPRASELSVGFSAALRSTPFRWLAVAFALASLTTTALSVHLVPLLLERGYRPAFAAGAMGMLGLMAMPGRLVFTPLGSRWPRGRVTAVIFALQALACLALLATDLEFSVWAFVVLFGVGFGAITPARAALVAERFGSADYGRISGALALVLAFARAAAPVGASWIHRLGGGSSGGYQPVLAVVLALSVAAGAAVLMSDDREGTSLSEPATDR